MQNDRMTDSAISRQMFADEILLAAAESLRRVGFSDEDVRDAFFRASGRVAQEPGIAMGAEGGMIEDDGHLAHPSTINRIVEQFNDLPETKSLCLVGDRLASLLASSDPSKAAKGIEMVRSALPLRKASILWLRATAASCGVPVSYCRSDWIIGGDQEDIRLADHVLFLDQFGIGGTEFIFNTLQLLESLVLSGNSEEAIDLCDLLYEDEVAIFGEERKRIEYIIDLIGVYQKFVQYIMDNTEVGEIDQKSTFSKFHRILARSDFEGVLEGWLEVIESRGIVVRQKRSDRIVVRRATEYGGRPY